MPRTSRMAVTYPAKYAEEWYSTWESMIAALDGHHFSAFEDRNLFIMDGGTWTWSATAGTLTWDAALVFTTPSTGNAQILAAGSVTLVDSEMMVVDLSRGASAPASLTAAADNVLEPDDAVLALCVRYGSKLYFRNGVVLDDGESFDVFSGGISDVRPTDVKDTFTATPGQTVFTLSSTPHSQCIPMVFRQGLLMLDGASDDYQISGSTVTFNYGVTGGQSVQVRYWT